MILAILFSSESKFQKKNYFSYSLAGNFTQVVWAGSKLLGVGQASYSDGDLTVQVVVTRYFPAGNIEGEFSSNVH